MLLVLHRIGTCIMRMFSQRRLGFARHFLRYLVTLLLAIPMMLLSLAASASVDTVYNPFTIPQGAYTAKFIKDVDNTSIIQFSGNYDRDLPDGTINAAARAVIAREFYRTHADDYDFLVVFSDFDFNMGGALAFCEPVQNHVKGIGIPDFDNASIFGSSHDKLQAFIDMGRFSHYQLNPLEPNYEAAQLTLAHEVLHRWGIHVKFKDANGQISSALIGHENAHWSFFVNSAASVEYGNEWQPLGNGKFKAVAANRFYSPMDLYLMGIYGPNEVPPFFYIQPSGGTHQKTDLSQPGVTITGTQKNVTINDVIAAEGPRVPDAQHSQKQFKFAFIYLKSPSSKISESRLRELSRFRQAFMTRFSILTGARAIAQVYPQAKPVNTVDQSSTVTGGAVRASSSSVSDALTWLRQAQATDGHWADKPDTQSRDTAVALNLLSHYDPNFSRAVPAEEWLASQSGLDNDSLARRLQDRTGPTGRSADAKVLQDRQNPDGGWGVQTGYGSDPLDTALVLRAVASIASATERSAATQYLLAQQGADGGWSAVAHSASQVTATALALDALHAAGVTGAPVDKAVTYLKSHQHSDGGFGDGQSTVHDTAQVLLTMANNGHFKDVDGAAAVTFIANNQDVAGDWAGSVYTTALAVAAIQSSNFGNWAVTGVTATPNKILDGQRVHFTATVKNDSHKAMDPTVMRVYKGAKVDSSQQLSGDIPVPAIPAGGAVTVDYYWDSLNHAGDNNFTFAIDPDNTVAERSELDNTAQASVTVGAAPKGIDLELDDGAVTATPSAPMLLPTSESISGSLRNAGATDSGPAVVRLLRLDAGSSQWTKVGETTVDVPGRQTSVVNFVADVIKPGQTRFRMVADPDNAISEADETNNQGTITITPKGTVDLAVDATSVSMSPNQANVGEDVTFTIVIRNQGTLPAAPTTVRYSLGTDTGEKVLRTNNIVLGAGESVVHTLTWRVDSAGPKRLIVDVDPDNTVSEVDETNNHYEYKFDAQVLQGTNVGVDHQDIAVSPAPLLEGYGATVSAVVKNTGSVAVSNVKVAFYNGNPDQGGTLIGQTTAASIASGARANVSVVWDKVPDSAQKIIYVKVDPGNQLKEFNEQDNEAFETFDVKPLPDLAVNDGSLVLNPAFPKEGETANITLNVSNIGDQAVDQVPVALYSGDPTQGGSLIGSATIAHIDAHGTGSAQFSYTFPAAKAQQTLVAWVNKDGSILEKTTSNNRAERDLSIQNSNFYVSERYFSPNGDGIKDTTKFSFRLQQSQTVQVQVVDARGLVLRTYKGKGLTDVSDGSVVWDGRNDYGAIVDDGSYTLQVVDSGGNVLGKTTTDVDTNRSSLMKALGTKYEDQLPDLGQALGNSRTFNYAPDDHDVYFLAGIYSTSSSFKPSEAGIFHTTVHGANPTPVFIFSQRTDTKGQGTAFNQNLLISPDSQTLIANEGYHRIFAISADGSKVKKLLSLTELQKSIGGLTYNSNWRWKNLTFSHDGQWLYYIKDTGSQVQAFGRVPTDGHTGPQTLAVFDSQYNYILKIFPAYQNDQAFIVAVKASDGNNQLIHVNFTSQAVTDVLAMGNPSASIDSDPTSQVALSPDGSRLAAATSHSAEVYLYDLSGKQIAHWSALSSPPGPSDHVSVAKVAWNPNSIDLAYQLDFFGPDVCPDSTHQSASGFYVVNTANGKQRQVAELDEYENCNGGPIGGGGMLSIKQALAANRPLYADTTINSPPTGSGSTSVPVAFGKDNNGMFWLRNDPNNWIWSPGERRLLLMVHSSYGQIPYNPVYRPSSVVAVDVDQQGQYQEYFKNSNFDFNVVSVSPSGRTLTIGGFSFQSLLNMSLDLRALSSAAVGGVSVSGTVSDLNLDHYQLQYASYTTPSDWHPVGPDGQVSVVDGKLTDWVPPKPDTYYLKLTAFDKAGNSRQRITRASWGEQAAITDLYREPGYISPNGDGVQDQVAIKFKVLTPTNLTLQVFNASGELVRTIAKSFDLIGSQQSIVWDGRDDSGSKVADGVYRLMLGKYQYSVTVDDTPPSVTVPPVPNLLQSSGCAADNQSCTPLVSIDTELPFQFSDANYYRYQIEQEDTPGHWITRQQGDLNDPAVPGSFKLNLQDLSSLDKPYRIVVEDLAGNKTTKAFDLTPKAQKVVLVYGHDHTGAGGVALENRPLLANTHLPYANYGQVSSQLSGIGFGTERFGAIESISRPISSVAIQYRVHQSQQTGGWSEAAVTHFVKRLCALGVAGATSCQYDSVSAPSQNALEFLFDTSQFNPENAYDLRLKLVDDTGQAYYSNGVYFESSMQFGVASLTDLSPSSAAALGISDTSGKLSVINTVVNKFPEPVKKAYITIQSDDDSRYLKAQRLDPVTADWSDAPQFVLDNTVPCGTYHLELFLQGELSGKIYAQPGGAKTFKSACFGIHYKVTPVIPEKCGASPSNKLQFSATVYVDNSSPNGASPAGQNTAQYKVLLWQLVDKAAGTSKTLFAQNNPQLGTPYGFQLDTSKYAEGSLDIRVKAVREDDVSESQAFEVPIDHTPPQLDIQYPQAKSQICAIGFKQKEASGWLDRRGTELSANILDPHGSKLSYSVNYDSSTVQAFPLPPAQDKTLAITNDPAAPQSVASTLEFADSGLPVTRAIPRQTITGNVLVNGRVGALALPNSGDVTAHLEVNDFGTYKMCASRTFHLDSSIDGLSITSGDQFVSPNGDGHFDSANVNLTVGEDVKVDMSIHRALTGAPPQPAQDTLVWVKKGLTVAPGTTKLTWDGTNGGTPVPDGQYFILVKVTDSCGNTSEFKHLVTVDNTPPHAVLAYPQNGDPMGVRTEIGGTVQDAHLKDYQLEFIPDGQKTGMPVASGSTQKSDEVLGVWDTYGLSGKGNLRLTAQDEAGNVTVINDELTIPKRSDLISSLDTDTSYISPNGDGRKDTATLKIGLQQAVLVDVYLDSADKTRIGQLASGLDGSGSSLLYHWNGSYNGTKVADGDYQLEIVARSKDNNAYQQTEYVREVVDTVAPTVNIGGISNGFVTKGSAITGDVKDANLDHYTYFEATDPNAPTWVTVLQGQLAGSGIRLHTFNQNTADEGHFALKLTAVDKAGNQTNVVLPYIVDMTPPQITITSPQPQVVTGVLKKTLNLEGTISEAHLKQYRILYLAEGSKTETQLLQSTQVPTSQTLGSVDVTKLPEGNVTLIVEATDKANWVSRQELPIIVDNTAPAVTLTSPTADGYVTKPGAITGSVSDPHFATYRVEYASGSNAANDSTWMPLIQGAQAVSNGNLAYWNTLPKDGDYTLRVIAKDQAGNAKTVSRNFTVDTIPPGAPTISSVTPEKDKGVQLNWSAVSAPDLAGYLILRSGNPVQPGLVTGTQFLDPLTAEGTYTYQVIAVDKAGNRSQPSAGKTVHVDWTPPEVALISPANNHLISGLADVQGTAYSKGDFAEYRLSIGAGATPQSWQEIAHSSLPLISSELAQWNTLDLAQGGVYTLKLDAKDVSGNEASTEVTVTVDNKAPAAPTGLKASVSGNNVSLTWSANSESDLAGYYLFANGHLVNATGPVVGNMAPYQLTTTQYADSGKPDGQFQYLVYAVDKAGNISASSQPAKVVIETHAPHVTFAKPQANAVFEKSLYLEATTPDRDIASVDFKYRAKGASTWTPIGTVSGDVALSYSWSTETLGYGDYELEAVATDTHGNVDANPQILTVSKKDLTPPAAAQGLKSKVQGGDVALNWTANTESDLAGYYVERGDGSGSFTRLTSSPVSSNSYQDKGLADGNYQYRIVATDLADNEAQPSDTVAAQIYAPMVTPPYTPSSAAKVEISGKSTVAGNVQATLSNILGTQTIGTVATDANGVFKWTGVALQPGDNDLTVVEHDSAGNTSKTVNYRLVQGNPPASPQNLAATVSGHDVTLTWGANTEKNIAGYRVYDSQNGPLQPDAPVAIASAQSTNYIASYDPSKAIDGNTSTYFWPDTSGQTHGSLTLDLKQPALVTRVDINKVLNNDTPRNFDVEVWTGTYWLPVVSVKDQVENAVNLPKPYFTGKVRIVFTAYQYYTRVNEIQVYAAPLVTKTTYLASSQGNGHKSYHVTAVSDLGMESQPSVSVSTAVGDVIPPEPVTLSGVVVAEHDASLSWTPSSSTDTAGYRIYRDGQIVTSVGAAATDYTDANLKNGTYLYTVKAIDGVGNLSTASNGISLTVAVAPLAAPANLSVAPAPKGKLLNLAWQDTDKAAQDFVVFRALAADGPFQKVDETAGQSYQDDALTNGTTYFYKVRAIDALGNLGAASNEASGTPADTLPPVKPKLILPVPSGKTGTVNAASATLIGFAEPGATVAPFINGSMGVKTQAGEGSTLFQQDGADTVGSVSPDGHWQLISASGQSALINLSNPVGNSWHNLPLALIRYVVWTNDSKAAFVIASQPSSFGMGQIYRLDLDTKTVTPLNLGSDYYSVDWVGLEKTNGNVLIHVSSYLNSMRGFWTLDPKTGAKITGPVAVSGYPAMSTFSVAPNGKFGVWRTGSDLELVTMATGAVSQVVTDANAAGDRVSWKSDSSGFAYRGNHQIELYSLSAAKSSTLIADSNAQLVSPTLTSTDWLVYLREPADAGVAATIETLDLATGDKSVWDQLAPSQPIPDSFALSQSDILTLSYSSPLSSVVYKPAGRFTLPVTLSQGENDTTVVAEDAAGNASDPSDVSTIIYSLGDRPDLAVTASLNPAIPSVGSSAEVRLDIANKGDKDAPATTVSVAVLAPDGSEQKLLDGAALAPTPQGAVQTLNLRWNVPNNAGLYHLLASVDDQGLIKEKSKSNNTLINDVRVLASGSPAMISSLNRNSFASNDDVTDVLTVANPGESFAGSVDVRVVDDQGYLVKTLADNLPIAVAAGAQKAVNYTWNTGQTFAGNYHLVARLLDSNGTKISGTNDQFTINAVANPSLAVKTDRATYSSNADVHLSVGVGNAGGNAAIRNATLKLSIQDAAGDTVFDQSKSIGEVDPDDVQDVSESWNTAKTTPGQFQIQAVLTASDGSTLVQSSGQFAIKPSKPVLNAQLTLQNAAVSAGASFSPTYKVENDGNSEIQGLGLALNFSQVDDSTPINTDQASADIAAGADFQSTSVFLTDSLPVGTYRLQLVASYAFEGVNYQEVLATQFVKLVDTTPPTVKILNPAAGSTVNAKRTRALVFSSDDLSGVQSVQLKIDQGDWLPLTGDGVNSSFDLSGLANGTHQIYAKATDNAGNESSPVQTSFTVDDVAPKITISGVSDGAFYATAVTPVVTVQNATISKIEMNGSPFTPGTVESSEGVYHLYAYGEDAAQNTSRTYVNFVIDKTAPVISVSGVKDQGLYNKPVTPNIQVTDLHLDSTTVTMNGKPFASGQTISDDGKYTLLVSATDKAGNVKQSSLSFQVDRTPPAAPTVTNIHDGDTIKSDKLKLVGQAEAGSVVDLKVAGKDYSNVTDDAGTFSFSGIKLSRGQYKLALTATDRAGNRSKETDLTVTIHPKPLLSVTGEITAKAHVLAWIPERDKGGKRDDRPRSPSAYQNLATFIGATYDQGHVDYKLVGNEEDFLNALRSRRYDIVLVGSLNPDRGFRLHMSKATAMEIRGVVGAGTGLIWINTHPGELESWEGIVGAHLEGAVDHINAVKLEKGPASVAGEWKFGDARGIRAKLAGGIGVGQLEVTCHHSGWHFWEHDEHCGKASDGDSDDVAPALVINKYGAGGVAMLTFNPNQLEDPAAASTILLDVTHYATPSQPDSARNAVVDINWHVGKIRPSMTLAAQESLSDGMKFESVPSGDLVDPQDASWTRKVDGTDTDFDAQVRLSGDKGNYLSNIALYDTVPGAGTLLAKSKLNVPITAGRNDLELDYMNALDGINFKLIEYWPVHMATVYAEAATVRDLNSESQVERSILELEVSLSWLRHVDSVRSAQSLISGGRLLEYYESVWYRMRSRDEEDENQHPQNHGHGHEHDPDDGRD